MSPNRGLNVRVYVLSAALSAIGGLIVARAHDSNPGALVTSRVGRVILLVLLVIGSFRVVRFQFRNQVQAFDLMEVALLPLLATQGPVTVVAMVVLTKALHAFVYRLPLVKAAFNVAAWTLSVASATFLYAQLRSGPPLAPRNVAVLAAGLAVVAIGTHLCVSLVVSLVERRPLLEVLLALSAESAWGIVATWAAGSAMGLVFLAAYLTAPWSLALMVVPLVLLHWAAEAMAAVRTDSRRLKALQQATQALGRPVNPLDGVPEFLREAAACFEAQSAAAILTTPERSWWHGLEYSARERALTPLLAAGGDHPQRIKSTDDGATAALLRDSGLRDCVLAPVVTGRGQVGVLAMFDRTGMEGFGEGELAVLTALARELATSVEKAELMETLDEERRTLAKIVDATSDGILMLAGDGTITSWNAGMAAITGHRPRAMVGTNHIGLLRARDTHGRDVLLERWSASDPASLPTDIQIVNADGETVWLSCSYSPVTSGEPALVVVARDVTAARELEQLKDDFIAVVSHELRTPLSPIKGWASTLLNRGERMEPEQRREGLQAILRQSQRLEQLIYNILDASRIESGGHDLRHETADLSAVAARVVDEIGSTRPDRTIRLEGTDVPRSAYGSAVWMERALANLLTNALKYSPPTEPVDVRLDARDGLVLLSVTDRGPGIRAEDQERIFVRFERLRDAQTQTGTGLGLYITSQLLRAMGGSVGVHSVPGAGSTFTIRLRSADIAVPPPRGEARERWLALD